MQGAIEQLGGKPFYVRHWGDPGLPPLLLLHGFPEYGGAWAELAEALPTGFTVSRRINVVLARAGPPRVWSITQHQPLSAIWRL